MGHSITKSSRRRIAACLDGRFVVHDDSETSLQELVLQKQFYVYHSNTLLVLWIEEKHVS
jgi:hypothetical protein